MISDHFATKSGASLRVLEVTPRYYPYVGGTENHVYQVSRRLAQAGVDVTVLTTDPTKRLSPMETIEGVKIERVRAWPENRDYYFAPHLWNKIRKGSWDLVHVQSYHTLVPPMAMTAALRAGIPYLVTFHGGGHSSGLRNSVRGLQRTLLRPLFARAERLVAVARFEIDFYGKALRIPEGKFCLIPNGADLPALSGQKTSTGFKGSLIASIGRLEKYKGHQRVIRALPKLMEMIPDVHLWIAGTGPYETVLQELASELGVAERVEIRAIRANQRELMAEELSRAALVVLMSEYETHPIAILEALALGRPVLVANTSGLREIAEKGWARAIPLDSSPADLAAAIVEQIQHPIQGENIQLPTWDDCSRELLFLYRSVVQEIQ